MPVISISIPNAMYFDAETTRHALNPVPGVSSFYNRAIQEYVERLKHPVVPPRPPKPDLKGCNKIEKELILETWNTKCAAWDAKHGAQKP